MSVEFIRGEVWYYTGVKPTLKEVEEIKYFVEQNPESELSEIISDYYGCE